MVLVMGERPLVGSLYPWMPCCCNGEWELCAAYQQETAKNGTVTAERAPPTHIGVAVGPQAARAETGPVAVYGVGPPRHTGRRTGIIETGAGLATRQPLWAEGW